MLNKKNIACLIFVFLSLKIYAEDDFNVISQCTDEYETSCDLVLINGNEKNILVLVKSFKMKPKHLEEETATEIDEYFGTFVINTQPVGQLEKRGDKYEFIKGIKNISIPPNGVSVASDEEIKNIFYKL